MGWDVPVGKKLEDGEEEAVVYVGTYRTVTVGYS